MTETADPTATDRSLVFECELDAPPERVWRALTERALVAQWLMPNDMRAAAGARFQFRPAANDDALREPAIECEVIEVDPPHRLSYSWREGPRDARRLDSTVTFVLHAIAGGGTRLIIVHDGAAALPATRHAPLMSAAPLRLAA